MNTTTIAEAYDALVRVKAEASNPIIDAAVKELACLMVTGGRGRVKYKAFCTQCGKEFELTIRRRNAILKGGKVVHLGDCQGLIQLLGE